MKLFIIGQFTKLDLMKALYTEEELRQVDTAIDRDHWDQVDATMWYVTDYTNGNGPFGKLVDLRHRALDKGVVILSEEHRGFWTELVAQQMGLLEDALDALNEIPNTPIRSERYRDSYQVAAALSKYLKQQGG